MYNVPESNFRMSNATNGPGDVPRGKDRFTEYDVFRRNPTSPDSMPFQRQDSLAICADLQEKDRSRSEMLDFMETSLDLSNYLNCFNELNVPADQIDLDDNELQKAHILYEDPANGEHSVYGGNSQYEPEQAQPTSDFEYYQAEIPDDEEAYVMQCDVPQKEAATVVDVQVEGNTPRPTRTLKRPAHMTEMMPKAEPIEDWDDSTSTSSYASEKKIRQRKGGPGDESNVDYKPQTKARKYQLKPEQEKAQPQYRLKRARNNDAVRKSRNKAKEQQKQREKENDNMRLRIRELEALLDAEKKARDRDRQVISELLQAKNCNCYNKIMRKN
ncbi:unnamed protein product [Caenorhabditis auriculariae]|uniref:BZIP domain-containing protein n=1 Tax=Caenorhabditis auriculariae TaxID=2777116 RepID=A0A8S1GVI6_9PELO|nr:unnamed protein product [Caenorhabditis auriculariae]